jgi:hypothetical protein
MTQETLEKTFQVSGPARLSLSNIRGSVDLQRGEDQQIQVTAVKLARTGDVDDTQVEWSQSADGTVSVATHFRDAPWSWLFGSHPCRVDYVVKAPRTCSLQVRGVSNTVFMQGFEGTFDVRSVSGQVTLRDLTGSIRIHTVSGEISAEELTGELHLDSVSADAEFKKVNLPSVDAKTVSGKVDLQTTFGAGPYRFRSVSGDVHLRVPPESCCSVELRSVSGEIQTEFPLTRTSITRGSQSAEVQGGGVPVSLDSISGVLQLDCDGELQGAASFKKTLSSQERRAVLEQVERGELTLEDALARLRV